MASIVGSGSGYPYDPRSSKSREDDFWSKVQKEDQKIAKQRSQNTKKQEAFYQQMRGRKLRPYKPSN